MRKFNDRRISIFLKDPDKKGVFQILREMVTLLFLKKEFPFYYFLFPYKRKVKNYKDYLSTGEKLKIFHSKSLHKPEFESLLENKLFFALFCENTSIKTPKLISYNLASTFFYNGTVTIVNSKDELIWFFRKVFEESKITELFFRPSEAYGGFGCFKLTADNFNDKLAHVYHNLFNGLFLQTEVLKQHKAINSIQSNSINTVRLVTFVTLEGVTEIIIAYMRFGVGDSVVDNFASGGCLVRIDLESGILEDTGYTGPAEGENEVNMHPDSGFKFAGFKVPYFKEACQAVKDGAEIIPERLIAWDVAITPEGPVIIEAGRTPGLAACDIAYGGILQNEHVRAMMKEIKAER